MDNMTSLIHYLNSKINEGKDDCPISMLTTITDRSDLVHKKWIEIRFKDETTLELVEK
jgi:hypothetical protein